jgi:peptide/nickel transport system ATP-binding protein
MYAGRLVEVAPVEEIFEEPLHPYTQLLIASLPSLEERGNFRGIPGLPPSLLDRPVGCSFRARCPHAMPVCAVEDPALLEVRTGRWVACHLYDAAEAKSA